MYKRVLAKISGEALMGDLGFGVDAEATSQTAKNIAELALAGHQVGIVIGGGNIFRGIQQQAILKLERTPADQMGMLATFINGIAMREALKQIGCEVILMSAVDCPLIAEKYEWQKALSVLEQGKVILFVGGTGHPYFTTDSAAALRACEIKADILLKGTTHVDGVYDKDPLINKDAKKFESLSYLEVVEKKLGVMDLTAITLCMSNGIPVKVFNFYKESLLGAVTNPSSGTTIK